MIGIKGIEDMPENCAKCLLYVVPICSAKRNDDKSGITRHKYVDDDAYDNRPQWCPLVKVENAQSGKE